MNNLKWQIHAETSITQACLWLVIGKQWGGWVWIIAIFFIIGNLITTLKATKQLPKTYFAKPEVAASNDTN